MKRYERDVTINADLGTVFDFFADMARLPEWATEDFVSVKLETEGAIGHGSRFAYVTRGAKAESTFSWTTFQPHAELVFEGPRVDVGPGWVEGLGGYAFEKTAQGIRVRAWFEPKLGGLLALMSPFARMRNVRLLGHQLARAKSLIESKTPRVAA